MVDNCSNVSFGAIKYPIQYARINSDVIPKLEDKGVVLIKRAFGTQRVIAADSFHNLVGKDYTNCISDYGKNSKRWDKFMMDGLTKLGIPVEHIKQESKLSSLFKRIFS